MPLLFSYGTLQQEEVQLSTFGRKLNGEKDLLTGYEPSLVKIADPEVARRLQKLHHDNVSKTDDEWSNVQGTVFEVTDEELAKSDAFEAQFNYQRIIVPLASGNEAWVYVHAGR
ncbi:MAG: gamma-glutamylcyclotransferase [Cyanobacteria bacterium]|nr:gamma-glutamylcyclotransferase [Cyanobacteriota bacterium]